MPDRPTVIVSNRGPVSFRLDDHGQPVGRRGAGGLVSGLAPLVRNTGTLWVAAAMTDGDRLIADRGVTNAEGFRVRLLAAGADDWAAHYDTVCNESLWFAHHGLFDQVYGPSWPAGWVEGPWAAHRRVNRAFADVVADDAPEGATVLVQDYHLCLLAPALAEQRPDLRLVHFSHTPFAPPQWLRWLPAAARRELLEGLAAYTACGFHSARWEADFLACCADEGITPPATFVAPLGPDPADLAVVAGGAPCAAAAAELDAVIGDRSFLVRVDRIELSKNLVRGFDAFEALLDAEPERRGRVIFGAFVYPSRPGVPAYDAYRRVVAERVAAINARFATADWTPVLLDDRDDFPRSVAALARADVVLVNPVRDGLNLVAKEAMVLNQRDAQLVLSPEAGAWDELGHAAFRADPFDIGATADALRQALDVTGDERTRRAIALRDASLARSPAQWLADQLAAPD